MYKKPEHLRVSRQSGGEAVLETQRVFNEVPPPAVPFARLIRFALRKTGCRYGRANKTVLLNLAKQCVY